MYRINVLLKDSTEIPCPFHHVKAKQEVQAMSQEERPEQNTTMLVP